MSIFPLITFLDSIPSLNSLSFNDLSEENAAVGVAVKPAVKSTRELTSDHVILGYHSKNLHNVTTIPLATFLKLIPRFELVSFDSISDNNQELDLVRNPPVVIRVITKLTLSVTYSSELTVNGLLKFLRHIPSLKSLSLIGFPTKIHTVDNAPKLCKTLTKVSIFGNGCPINKESLLLLVHFLSCLPGLEALSLENFPLKQFEHVENLPDLSTTLTEVTVLGHKNYMYMNKFDIVSTTSLVDFLNCIPTIKTISLKGISLRDGSIENLELMKVSLQRLKRRFQSLESVIVNNVSFDSFVGAHFLSILLSKQGRLKTLRLCNSKFPATVNVYNKISDDLLLSLIVLELDRTVINCARFSAKDFIMPCTSSLLELSLSNANMKEAHCKRLCKAIISHGSIPLTSIDLSNNVIGNETKYFVQTLWRMSCLKKVTVRNCQLRTSEFKLPNLLNITEIDLSENKFGDNLSMFSHNLRYKSNLTVLKLSQTSLTINLLKGLPLKFFFELTTLDLSNNNIGYDGVSVLVESLLNHKRNQFSHLNLANNDIDNYGVKCLCQSFPELAPLKYLNLQGNKAIGPEGEQLLFQNLVHFDRLTFLGISSSMSRFCIDLVGLRYKQWEKLDPFLYNLETWEKYRLLTECICNLFSKPVWGFNYHSNYLDGDAIRSTFKVVGRF